MKHIFIINPNAGKGKAYNFIKPGDGTLYEIVNGAYGHENVEVTVIPLGSGNDFIRLFGEKEDFYNLENLVNGVPVCLDVIKCGDEIAINQCSMGFDAEVCARQASFKKVPGINGELAYVASAIYSISRKVKNTFTVQIDDGEPFTQDCIFCVGANSRWYGGGFMAAPKALPDDGLMDMIIVKKTIGRLKLLSLLNDYKAGNHLSWDMTNFVRGKKLKIHSDKPAAVNVDGECSYVRIFEDPEPVFSAAERTERVRNIHESIYVKSSCDKYRNCSHQQSCSSRRYRKSAADIINQSVYKSDGNTYPWEN